MHAHHYDKYASILHSLFFFLYIYLFFFSFNYKSKTLYCCFDVVSIYIDYMLEASLLLAYHKVANRIPQS